jgi:hypothetical protein
MSNLEVTRISAYALLVEDDRLLLCRLSSDLPHARRPTCAYLLYLADVIDGALRYEEGGTTDMCQWHPIEALDSLPMVELVTAVLPTIRRRARTKAQ